MAAYLELYYNGKLAERVEATRTLLRECCVCPRHCTVKRIGGETGKCNTASLARVSSYGAHFGEEAPLVGRNGSGTIFFANCNLKCLFCQNYTISHLGDGTEVTSTELAEMMLSLQSRGCHNINLVSPTHVIPQILEALNVAISMGLNIPLVYNSGGYDSIETLQLLAGIIDIYMPDMKYSDEKTAKELSGIEQYPEINQSAVREMHHQVGDLQIDSDGIATRGLLIRHLVLPQALAGTEQIVEFISSNISTNSYVNIMAQYHPCYRASKIPGLSRQLLQREFDEAVELALKAGLKRLDKAHPLIMRTF